VFRCPWGAPDVGVRFRSPVVVAIASFFCWLTDWCLFFTWVLVLGPVLQLLDWLLRPIPRRTRGG